MGSRKARRECVGGGGIRVYVCVWGGKCVYSLREK